MMMMMMTWNMYDDNDMLDMMILVDDKNDCRWLWQWWWW